MNPFETWQEVWRLRFLGDHTRASQMAARLREADAHLVRCARCDDVWDQRAAEECPAPKCVAFRAWAEAQPQGEEPDGNPTEAP